MGRDRRRCGWPRACLEAEQPPPARVNANGPSPGPSGARKSKELNRKEMRVSAINAALVDPTNGAEGEMDSEPARAGHL